MKTQIAQIFDCIERTFDVGGIDLSRKIIVYPCGEIGMWLISILREVYSIEPAYMLDNSKCRYSEKIHELSLLKELDPREYVLLLASTNLDIYEELREAVLEYFPEWRILEFDSMKEIRISKLLKKRKKLYPKCGKYSYGPLCKDHLVESIGAFCSFAEGTKVGVNHAIDYISTHPFIYDYEVDAMKAFGVNCYKDAEPASYYFPGVNPYATLKNVRRVRIGNDVWLGQNVVITNGAYIGNGVIAGAGAVITKDIPDYAVVVGVPARIIRFRYTPEQIEALNKIAWWDWTDDEIRERYEDFYLPVEEFIKIYLK